MLKRLAELYARGADKYGDWNWQKAETPIEYQRFIGSAFRHFEQWRAGNQDEDHASGAIWNIMAYEWHMERVAKEEPDTKEQDPTLLEQSDYGEGFQIDNTGGAELILVETDDNDVIISKDSSSSN